jgi:hypothetical protein
MAGSGNDIIPISRRKYIDMLAENPELPLHIDEEAKTAPI